MKFTESHEWITLEEGVGTVGITNTAQRELGGIVYVKLPPLGKEVKAGEEIAILESTKAATDIYSPVSGVVIAINEEVQSATSIINSSAEEKGWLFKIKVAKPQELERLLTREQYTNLF
jgi:glycine cleavage system H protein